MINLYLDFDGVIKDTIKVSYKMMEKLGISLNDKSSIIKFYQDINWHELLKNSDELNNAFCYIDKIIKEEIYKPYILTTVNSLEEMIAKTNYIRTKNEEITIICVPNGIEKNEIVNASGSILVDDYSKNLSNWEKAGGIGIKFGFDKNYISISSLKSFVKEAKEKNLVLKWIALSMIIWYDYIGNKISLLI